MALLLRPADAWPLATSPTRSPPPRTPERARCAHCCVAAQRAAPAFCASALCPARARSSESPLRAHAFAGCRQAAGVRAAGQAAQHARGFRGGGASCQGRRQGGCAGCQRRAGDGAVHAGDPPPLPRVRGAHARVRIPATRLRIADAHSESGCWWRPARKSLEHPAADRRPATVGASRARSGAARAI